MKKLIFAILIVFALSSVALAAKIKLDAYGGHYDSSTGKYHVQEGPLAGRTYTNQENMFNDLNKIQAPAPPSRIKSDDASRGQRDAVGR